MIKFKLLESSPDSIPFYGLVKSQAQAFISALQNREEGFSKTYTIRDIPVRMIGKLVGPDWVVRVWLGTGEAEYVFLGTLPRLCACRTVHIVEREGPDQTVVVIAEDGDPAGTVLVSESLSIDADDNRLDYAPITSWSGGGYLDLYDDVDFGGPDTTDDREYSHRLTFTVPDDACRPPKPDDYLSEDYPSMNVEVISESISSSQSGANIPYEAGTRTTTSMRDLSVRITFSDGSEQIVVGHETMVRTNTLTTNGGTYWTQNVTYSNFPSYVVAPGPAPDFIPSVAVVNGSYGAQSFPASSFNNVVTSYIPNKYPSTQDDLATDWGQARTQATERARAFAKACSDNAMALLDEGIIDPSYEREMKRGHPSSNFTRMPTYMYVKSTLSTPVEEDQVVESGTVMRHRRYQTSTTELSYVDANGNTQIASFSGSKEVITQRHKSSDDGLGAYSGTSVTTTYVKWFAMDTDGVEVPLTKLYLYQEDSPNSDAQDFGYLEGSHVTSTMDVSLKGLGYTPAMPYPVDLPTPVYPSIYQQYRHDVLPIYSTTSTDPVVDVRFSEDEEVQIVPLFFVHPTLGNVGHVPMGFDTGNESVEDDYAECTTVIVDRVYTARYSLTEGVFRFVNKKVLPVPAVLPAIKRIGTVPIKFNSLFVFSGAEYADLKAVFAAQARIIKSPPEDDPQTPLILFVKDVLNAIK